MTRWKAGLGTCVLGALGAAAAFLPLGSADPLVMLLAMFVAVWLAWLAFDFAFAPLRAAQGEAAKSPNSA